MSRFTLLFASILVVTLVVACTPAPTATPVPPTATATSIPPTSTPMPPTATPVPPTLTPAVVIDASVSKKLGIVDVYVSDSSENIFSMTKKIPAVFPSGAKRFSAVIVFDYRPPNGTSFAFQIRNSEGKIVERGGISMLGSDPTGRKFKVFMPYEAASGLFLDGAYQGTVIINDSPYAELNWIVGTP